MIRYLVGLIIAFLAWTFMRSILGIVQNAVVNEVKSAMGGEDGQAAAPGAKAPAPTAQTTLRKCVTCGTYKPEAAMIRHGSGASGAFFCSSDCKSKATA